MSESGAVGDRLIVLVADIVSAYVSNNHIQSADLPRLLGDVHGAIQTISVLPVKVSDGEPHKVSTQEIKRSISHDYLVSFEDGKPYKTLRRHLTLRGLSAEQYRSKWGLPVDYPMTSAGYSEQRSELARSLGLGQQRRRSPSKIDPEPENDAKAAGPKTEQPVTADRKRGSSRKRDS